VRRARVFLTILLAGVLAACTTAQSAPPYQIPTGIHKIKHVIVIQQENRSFDSYFGTYPGANGIPMNVCLTPTLPSPASGGGKNCEKPYVDHADVNGGGPHGQSNATADINGGKMDGFVAEARRAARGCLDPTNPACANGATTDVMGYHTASDIPNYWAYAKDFVLQDRMFEPNASWSLPAHLFMVSEWSARCANRNDPFSCTNALQNPNPSDGLPHYAWTDITYLLHRYGVLEEAEDIFHLHHNEIDQALADVMLAWASGGMARSFVVMSTAVGTSTCLIHFAL